jgi:hypothetical protein
MSLLPTAYGLNVIDVEGPGVTYLQNVQCEDEAEINGVLFVRVSGTQTLVQRVYSAPEYMSDPTVMSRKDAIRLFRDTLKSGYARVNSKRDLRQKLPLFFFPDVEGAYSDAVQRLRQRGGGIPDHNTRRQLGSQLRTWQKGQVTAKQVISSLRRIR